MHIHVKKIIHPLVISTFVLSLDLPPGELNPNAVPCGRLCFEFMNTGKYLFLSFYL